MYLENLVGDALEPRRVGLFWEELLGSEELYDQPEGYETRLSVDGGPDLDLGFQRVPDLPSGPPRLHLDILAADFEPGLLSDPEGTVCTIVAGEHADTGPLAALRLESADPDRDTEFWAWLTGWTVVAPRTLRHPSLRGAVLELCPEITPKVASKNRLHLDVRLEGEDPDAIEADILDRGGRLFEADWGELPWRTYQDPSGNEFCVLPTRA